MNSRSYPQNFEQNVTPVENDDFVRTHKTDAEKAYWANFYTGHEFGKGSSFSEFVKELPDMPSTVLDIGCGEGRDSAAFARAGKRVIGLDRSDVGVDHANHRAAQEGLDNDLVFAICDVSDSDAVQNAIEKARELAGGSDVCYYMRFFLHSIPEDVQESLLETLARHAKPGDSFAAEFRTDKDEERDKTFGNTHYRRYQNADEFSKNLQEKHGWSIQYETEESGLSPYGEEDPVLYRVIATRN